jgi:hypothetical protein
MTDLKGIFSELNGNSPIDMYRRNVQKLYVDKLIELLKPDYCGSICSSRCYIWFYERNLAQTDLPSIARGQLLSLKSDLKYPLQKYKIK